MWALLPLSHFQDLATADVAQAASYLQIGNEIFLSIVVVSLVTTIIAPLVFNSIFLKKERKNGRRHLLFL